MGIIELATRTDIVVRIYYFPPCYVKLTNVYPWMTSGRRSRHSGRPRTLARYIDLPIAREVCRSLQEGLESPDQGGPINRSDSISITTVASQAGGPTLSTRPPRSHDGGFAYGVNTQN